MGRFLTQKRRWRLEGWDTFSVHSYPLAGSYRSEWMARIDARLKLWVLEREQPSSQWGGQDGIQDQVWIIGPDGSRYRYVPTYRATKLGKSDHQVSEGSTA